MTGASDFAPDWASPPGDTVYDILSRRGLSLGDFAERLGQPLTEVTGLLEGHTRVTRQIATQLVNVCGGSVEFWINRDNQYQQDLRRQQTKAANWIHQLPLPDMIRFGWVQPRTRDQDKLAESLRFFDVPNISFWEQRYGRLGETVVFRTSPAFESKPIVVAAWLRQGEIQADAINCENWDANRLRALLSDLRPLTRQRDPNKFVPQLTTLCASCGVAVVVVRAPRGCPASGATRFVKPNKAILQLSFRFLTDDQFWFTFFHEIGHLLLHGEAELFLEGSGRLETKEESEANEFAASILIPTDSREALLRTQPSALTIARMARQLGISTGIVVGQLQHYKKVGPNHFNGLKARYRWEG